VVVTTPNASGRIDERVRDAGGRVERVRLGALHEGIAAARADGGAVVFAAEPWKHIHPAHGGWIDGIASAAVLTRLVAAEGLDGLREPITERPYRKVSIPCPDDRKVDAMDRLETTLPDSYPDASVDTEYGVRLEFEDASWTLVRPSGTEPYIRVYAEADDVDAFVEAVSTVVEAAIDESGN
jgi:phosphomannomutase